MKSLTIGKCKYRMRVYRKGVDLMHSLFELQKKKTGLFARWETVFTDNYRVCIDALKDVKNRIDRQEQEKQQPVVYINLEYSDLN